MSTRRGLTRTHGLTYIIIAINVIVYVYTSIIGGDVITTGDVPIFLYGQVNYMVMQYGWWWQLITSMFVHVNIVHIAGNMFFLLIFGLRAEEFFSTQEYLLIYFMSGLTGNVLTLLLGPNMVSAGASGAIFGMFGAVIIYVRRVVNQPVGGALMYAFLMLVLSAGLGVNVLAHLGGVVAGLLIGYVLATNRKTQITYRYQYSYQPR
jgi:rhomboid protease GluP